MESSDRTRTEQSNRVTVIGLGTMGSAIARAFLTSGFHTTVWNRTASRTAPLVEAGATATDTVSQAVAASPLTVICVLDSGAVEQVLAALDDQGAVLTDRVLVNVTSGTPAQARAIAHWADERGAQHLDSKIMGDPPYVGTDQIMFPFSGSRTAFDAQAPILRALGAIAYHGEDPGLAAVEFMGQVAASYEVLIGFLHTLRLVQAEGADVIDFSRRMAGTIAMFPTLLEGMGTAVERGVHPPDLGPLRVQAALMDDLIEHRESMGVEAVRMHEVKELMDRRIADGHGDEGFSSLFELITDRAHDPAPTRSLPTT